MVGAGVLGLPYAFSYLGWAGGLLSLTILCGVSLYTSYLLSELHEDGNIRLNTYREIGEHVWGEFIACALCLFLSHEMVCG